ncbi:MULTISPECIES: Maf family protein [Bacillus]|uniref:dTTP/UTP pyrophosphatase n=2 Tax=Bacillus TaxID=1386 RepID=A0A0M4FU57_9BACI|nr:MULTISPECIES: Maf family protein [Bacillus]ALC81855.1 septum formation protein Maf [Bacillus gobiensis]MBP1083166.1 septum formation protein [Bacillus capparidis]MED1097607.1 Maf family protein [Bacillus capparidis]
MKPLILASQSPRRKEILDLLQLPYSIVINEAEEKINRNLSHAENVQLLAEQKAGGIAEKYPQAVVIGADTMVCLKDKSFGKPKTAEEAALMLRELSGATHSVLTGVAIKSEDASVSFVEETKVTFWTLEEEEIWSYIHDSQPFDKAGAYGIQDRGALFVKTIIGDYYSVVGLPISKTMRALKEFGIHAF